MTYKDMTYSKAIDTIEHIEDRTEEEIGLAIYRILNMETIMAVNKDNLVKIIRYLFDMVYEMEADYCPVPDTPGVCRHEQREDEAVEQTAQKGTFCPLMVSGGNMHVNGRCIGTDCAWFCEFAGSCSIPLLAGMFADSEICRNVFEKDGERNSVVDAEKVQDVEVYTGGREHSWIIGGGFGNIGKRKDGAE